MTRTELTATLADLVARRHITATEAGRILALYDAGEFVPSDLPVVDEPDNNAWLLALVALLLLARGNATRRLPMAQRLKMRTRLRPSFEAETQRLAHLVIDGNLAPTAWRTQLQQAIARYTRQMAIAGAGGIPNAAMREWIDELLADQWDRLHHFETLLHGRTAVERPLSERQVAARSRQYGGLAWGAWFLGRGQDSAWGYIEQWVSRDDNAVCRYCARLHGQYFLPGQGPMPGWGCYGVCRCVRVLEYNPEIYARLTGEGVAA